MRAAKRLPCVQTLGGFLRFSSLRFSFDGKSCSNPCLFCRSFVACCSVYCFACRLGSLVLCPPLLPPLVAPPLAAPPHAPLAFPPLRGSCSREQNFLLSASIVWGDAPLGGSFSIVILCAAAPWRFFCFFLFSYCSCPRWGQVRQFAASVKGQPSAPLCLRLGGPLTIPPCFFAVPPPPRRHPPPSKSLGFSFAFLPLSVLHSFLTCKESLRFCS